MIKSCLPFIIDEETEILILGSQPSDLSLEKSEYYGNSGNDFWDLVGNAIGEDLIGESYYKRIEILKKNGIGLWDVIKSSERKGSMDCNIFEEEINDFSKLFDIYPKLKIIFLNGKKAGKYSYLFEDKIKTVVLPSSSGANRKNNKNRINEWKKISQSRF